ncbi:MAG: hypothetical protein NZM00_04325, partial [Anaerolinea sp.]|nr:hypothetical protein [Anaerolinea sp.]
MFESKRAPIYNVGIWGASGYAGQDLVEILSHHPNAAIRYGTSGTYAGEPIPHTDLCYIKPEQATFDGLDAVFLALPHGVSAQTAAQALEAGVMVIDLSADLRLATPDAYRRWYGHEHPHPELLPTVYGLPELNRVQIAGQRRVAAPGCYPTTTILGLYPLLKHDALDPT